MRAFLAIELDAALRAYVTRAIADVRAHVDALAPDAVCGWVRPEQIHLTIRFLGELSDTQVRAVAAALQRPLAVPPFDLALAGIDVFPSRGRPRVCWLGVAVGGDAVVQLERVVTARLASAVGPAAGDPFHPHVTLGRVRRPGMLRAATLRQAAPVSTSPTMRVDAITLFESRLVPAPARHLPVVRIPLSA